MASVNLNDFVSEDCIEFRADSKFLTSVARAAELLSLAGSASDDYPSEVVQIVTDKGPYMVVAPQVAIVHGRPSQQTVQSAMSLVISQTALISGSKNDPVRIVFAISSNSNEKHLEMLQTLSAFLLLPQSCLKLQNCSTVSEVRQILSSGLQ